MLPKDNNITQLLALLLITTLLCCASAITFYATPTSKTPCPRKGIPCMTLSEYANNSNNIFTSNTTLLLLPGNHFLDYDLAISNKTYLKISIDESDQAYLNPITVTCHHLARIRLAAIESVYIGGIQLIGCVNNTIVKVTKLSIKNFTVDGDYLEGTGLYVETCALSTMSQISCNATKKYYGNFGDAGCVTINNSNAYISESIFSENTAISGGAVSIMSSTISLDHCTFQYNRAVYGGAVIVQNSILEITNGLFVGNRASESCGSVVSLNSTVTIQHSMFLKNGVEHGYGGAVAAYNDSTLTIEQCSMCDNTADYGGTVAAVDSTLFINNSTFINSTAYVHGGVISSLGSAVTITNRSMFLNSTSRNSGGVLTGTSHSTLNIEQSIFDNNRAEVNGGGIAILLSDLTISSSSFTNNNADSGGAVSVMNGTIRISDGTEFINNLVESIGGAICATDTFTVVENSTSFNNNKANYGGGVAAIFNTCNIKDSKFVNNKAYTHGGAVYVLYGNISIDTSKFENSTTNHSGAVYIGNSIGEIYDSTFTSNIAGQAGGGIAAVNYTTFAIYSTTFLNNMAEDGGGAIIATNQTITTIDNCTLINNTADFGGGIALRSSTFNIENLVFISNGATKRGGALFAEQDTTIFVNNSFFSNNSAEYYGGAIRTEDNVIVITTSTFISNTVGGMGGAISVENSSGIITKVTLMRNKVRNSGGGALALASSNITIESSTFLNNTATNNSEPNKENKHSVINYGGAVFALFSNVTTVNCLFKNNTAKVGGAILLDCSNITIQASRFISNQGVVGGAIENMCILTNATYIMDLTDTDFSNNIASTGAAINIENGIVRSKGYLNIKGHTANTGVLYFLNCIVTLFGTTSFSDNFGSMVAVSSNVTISGETNFRNNSFDTQRSRKVWDSNFIEGGAITGFQSTLTLQGSMNLLENQGEYGGAILATESRLFMYGDTLISTNNVSSSGGGIYAYQSELNFLGNITLKSNRACNKGGGISAVGSTLKLIKGSLSLSNNMAEKGGGICLEEYAKLYIIKSKFENNQMRNSSADTWLKSEFSGNTAVYGGAVYVTDETNSGTCASIPFEHTGMISAECFFQVLYTYKTLDTPVYDPNLINVYFSHNTAQNAGKTLFGGLLNRCTVNPFAEILSNRSVTLTGIQYILNVTNLSESNLNSHVSSLAVSVCFCKNGKPDCSYQPPTHYVMKGQAFNTSVVAVDQVNNTLPSTIVHSYLSSGDGRLNEGQSSQLTNTHCSELQFNPFSPHNNETLFLYAEGPCNNISISQRSIEIKFNPCQCLIGFQPADKLSSCDCLCDPDLAPYITKCFTNNGSLLREGDFWITQIANKSDSNRSSLLIYPHCPFNYCYPPTKPVYVNLNTHNGADSQCAYNRTGKLCGSCRENLSLTLGSSRCMPCSNDWLTLLIPFALAGIVLVAFLLLCNLTVVAGTIHGLIFYANVITANNTIFFPNHRSAFLTVFIAWLNLDFGFETCFYDGMDGYTKAWLQLLFPSYIILLLVIVIIVSEHSKHFSRFLSKMNPVATLATLILLSYGKLLRTIITSLSSARLNYPDGSHELVWLYDANIPYLRGKHIPLILISILILIAGLVYTFLLFSWQWLLKILHYTEWRILKWCDNTKLHSFMDAYHAPYNKNARYWTGLLLFIRIPLYLISALDHIIGDVRVNLLTILCISGSIQLLLNDNVYRSRVLTVLERSFIFNLLIFTAATYHVRETNGDQTALAYTSTSIAFVTFMGILFYHTTITCKKIKSNTHDNTNIWRATFHTITNINNHQPRPFVTPLYYDTLTENDNSDSFQHEGIISITTIDGTPSDRENTNEETDNQISAEHCDLPNKENHEKSCNVHSPNHDTNNQLEPQELKTL